MTRRGPGNLRRGAPRVFAVAAIAAMLLAGAGAANSACEAQGTGATVTDAEKSQLTASAAKGAAPLVVRFCAEGGGKIYFGGVWLEFGDGEKAMACGPGMGCRQVMLDHTYRKPGEYEARLLGQMEGEEQELGRLRVEVE